MTLLRGDSAADVTGVSATALVRTIARRVSLSLQTPVAMPPAVAVLHGLSHTMAGDAVPVAA